MPTKFLIYCAHGKFLRPYQVWDGSTIIGEFFSRELARAAHPGVQPR